MQVEKKSFVVILGLIFLVSALLVPVPYFFFSTDQKNTKGSTYLDKKEKSVRGKLLLDDQYYKSLLRAIRDAQKSIRIITYVFQLDHFHQKRGTPVYNLAKTLKYKAKEGVNVDLILSSSQSRKDLVKVNQKAANILAEAGINTKLKLTPQDEQIHGKVVLIDNHKLFISNHNWTNAGLSENSEVAIYLQGTAIREEASRRINYKFESLFSDIHNYKTKSKKQHHPQKSTVKLSDEELNEFKPEKDLKEIQRFDFFLGTSMKDPIINLINQATGSIKMGMFYIMPKDTSKVRDIIDVLVDKAQSGVTVKIGVDHESDGLISYLRRKNVSARKYKSNKTQHIKAITVDSKYVFIGSHNLTLPALVGKNWESGVIFKSRPIAKRLNSYLEAQK
ncbi:MAG: phosphatidylserine/phosphatidylglycerophosphate/cardiolipin synthase family protein [bacterium]